jgi:hypothetical protein
MAEVDVSKLTLFEEAVLTSIDLDHLRGLAPNVAKRIG